MNRLFSLVLIIAAALGAAAQSRTHSLKIGTFTSLYVENNINVVCRFVPDSIGMASYTCEEAMADAFIFDRSRPNRLKVMVSPDFIDKTGQLPCVYVYTDMLELVEDSSDRTVSIENPARCPQFKAVLIGNGTLNVTGLDSPRVVGVLATGNGTLILDGQSNDTLLKLTGAGCIRAYELKSDKVVCHVFGGGEIFCWPLNSLQLKGLGSTRVYYRDTTARIKKSGLGKLIPMNN